VLLVVMKTDDRLGLTCSRTSPVACSVPLRGERSQHLSSTASPKRYENGGVSLDLGRVDVVEAATVKMARWRLLQPDTDLCIQESSRRTYTSRTRGPFSSTCFLASPVPFPQASQGIALPFERVKVGMSDVWRGPNGRQVTLASRTFSRSGRSLAEACLERRMLWPGKEVKTSVFSSLPLSSLPSSWGGGG
jgi:hypothetical protein